MKLVFGIEEYTGEKLKELEGVSERKALENANEVMKIC